MKHKKLAVAVYKSQTQAEAAIKEFRSSGFDMQKLSIIGRDDETDVPASDSDNPSERMASWRKTGAFWGGIWGGLFPGVGALLFAGPVIGWLVGALEGSLIVGGMGALGAGLVSVGVPEHRVLQYETALRLDRSVVIAHGTASTMAHARDIISGTELDSA